MISIPASADAKLVSRRVRFACLPEVRTFPACLASINLPQLRLKLPTGLSTLQAWIDILRHSLEDPCTDSRDVRSDDAVLVVLMTAATLHSSTVGRPGAVEVEAGTTRLGTGIDIVHGGFLGTVVFVVADLLFVVLIGE